MKFLGTLNFQRYWETPEDRSGAATSVSPPFVSHGTCSPTCQAAWEHAPKRRSVAAVAMARLLLAEGVSAGQWGAVGGAEGVLSDTELPAMPAESLKLSSI